MRKLAVITVSAVLAACATGSSGSGAGNGEPYADIAVAAAAELVATGDNVVVLDIRTPGEYAAGHIPGAVMVDCKAPDFADRLKKLDRSKTYVMH